MERKAHRLETFTWKILIDKIRFNIFDLLERYRYKNRKKSIVFTCHLFANHKNPARNCFYLFFETAPSLRSWLLSSPVRSPRLFPMGIILRYPPSYSPFFHSSSARMDSEISKNNLSITLSLKKKTYRWEKKKRTTTTTRIQIISLRFRSNRSRDIFHDFSIYFHDIAMLPRWETDEKGKRGREEKRGKNMRMKYKTRKALHALWGRYSTDVIAVFTEPSTFLELGWYWLRPLIK